MTVPSWWIEARRLREAGHAYAAIGRMLGHDHTTVMNALCPEYRARRLTQKRKREREHRRKGTRVETPMQRARAQLLKYARQEAREKGSTSDDVLLAWKAAPRHGGRAWPDQNLRS